MDSMLKDARRRLEERRLSLVHLAGENADAARELLDTESSHAREGAVERAESAMRARLSERDRHELAEIDAAILRLDRGTYGKCERCDGAVGRHRLQALPEARLCMACSSSRESVA